VLLTGFLRKVYGIVSAQLLITTAVAAAFLTFQPVRVYLSHTWLYVSVHALMLLVGWQEGHPACKKTDWWGAGVVVCSERGADLHMAHLMPLPLTVSCFSKIQTGFTFLVPAHPGSPGQRAIKWVCLCVCARVCVLAL